MINTNILKIASDTKHYGLKGDYTHQSKVRNRFCGDIIKIEIKIKKNKLKILRYETQSCIFCQASASILAKKINSFSVDKLKEDIDSFRKTMKNKERNLPARLASFKILINNNNLNRFDCIMLPFSALLKALKI